MNVSSTKSQSFEPINEPTNSATSRLKTAFATGAFIGAIAAVGTLFATAELGPLSFAAAAIVGSAVTLIATVILFISSSSKKDNTPPKLAETPRPMAFTQNPVPSIYTPNPTKVNAEPNFGQRCEEQSAPVIRVSDHEKLETKQASEKLKTAITELENKYEEEDKITREKYEEKDKKIEEKAKKSTEWLAIQNPTMEQAQEYLKETNREEIFNERLALTETEMTLKAIIAFANDEAEYDLKLQARNLEHKATRERIQNSLVSLREVQIQSTFSSVTLLLSKEQTQTVLAPYKEKYGALLNK